VVQIVCVRAALLVTCLTTFFVISNRREMLYPGDFKMQMLRGSLACGSVYLFIFGVSYVQLAEAAAAAYLGPIIMTALAPVMLGERVGIHRWTAVLLGFSGMLIMLRPSADSIAWAMLLPASAAVFGALRDIITRKMRNSGHPVTVLLYSNLIIAAQPLARLPVSPGYWVAFEEASVLAPFRYTGIIWGVLFGFLIWGQLPDHGVVLGAIVVIASGLYIYWRERRRSVDNVA